MNKKLRKWFRGLTAGKAVHFLLALLFPLYFTVVSSLKLDNEIWDTMFQLPSIPQWENYFKAAETAGILSAIVNSVVISLGSVAIMIVCVMMSSYVIARRLIKRAKALNLYLLAALMIPLQGAIVPIVQMVGAVGGKNNFFVLMLIYVGLNISISSFILVGYIVGFLNVYNELPIANVILTKTENRTISVALLAFQGDYQTSLSLIFASIVIVIIPILIFYLLCQEKVEHGLASGAIKG